MFRCIKNWFIDRFTDPCDRPARFRIQYRRLPGYPENYTWHLDEYLPAKPEGHFSKARVAGYSNYKTNADRQQLVDEVEKILDLEKKTEYYG